jgi:hypothetical protein
MGELFSVSGSSCMGAADDCDASTPLDVTVDSTGAVALGGSEGGLGAVAVVTVVVVCAKAICVTRVAPIAMAVTLSVFMGDLRDTSLSKVSAIG